MLSDLIISRVRVKMLTLFLSNSTKMFHVRDIVRKTGEEINAVRRELMHMEKHGMVSKDQRANRLFYKFRKEYLLYNELLELIAKTTGIGGDIIKNRAKLGKVKFAMLTGRFVRGMPKQSQTDVDMLLVGTIVLPELAQIVKAEELRRETEIYYAVMTEEEFLFRKKRKDPFLMDILYSGRIMVVGDELEMIA